jgi:sec-independent protein translocase protein TatA
MGNTFLLGWFGGQEIIIVLVIVLLLFGGKKIPELMKGLGKGMKEFKSATKDEKDSSDVNDDNDVSKAQEK